MPAKKKSILEEYQWAISISFLVLGALGAMFWNTFMVGKYAQEVATKTDLSQIYKESTKYTDETSAHVLKEAFDHSDANRQGMMLELEKMKTDIKTEQAKTGAKVDGVRDAIDELRQDFKRGNFHR